MLSDLDDFYCFAQVVEHGGFSAADENVKNFRPKTPKCKNVYKMDLGVFYVKSTYHSMKVIRHQKISLLTLSGFLLLHN